MALALGLSETTGRPLTLGQEWKIGPWADRLRAWVRQEVERGNTDKLIRAVFDA